LNKNPTTRPKQYLEKNNLWNDKNEIEFAKETKKQVNIVTQYLFLKNKIILYSCPLYLF